MSEHERCDACGFDGARFDDEALLAAVRGLGGQWSVLLESAGAELRLRPAPEVWSAIEYAEHTRDIVALHVYGVTEALTGDEPVLPPVDPGLADAAAVGYGDADAGVVAEEIDTHARRMAELADEAGSAAWTRGITVGDDRLEVRRLVEHALHDATHHLDDVERGLTQLRA